MSYSQFNKVLLIPFVLSIIYHLDNVGAKVGFHKNYVVSYGYDHVSLLDNGRKVQLSMDMASGSGFRSKKSYSSGFFEMKIKLPEQQSPGLVSTFYLTSNGLEGQDTENHDEIDFEFLGTDGPPFILQTNIFANDNGGREQRLKLWFDPTKDFHNYAILWNQAQIVLFVDNMPIRVYKNNNSFGVRYPSMPMLLEGSIWNGESWASGGRKIDWSKAPFQLQYEGFKINGCESENKECYSNTFWWNIGEYLDLTPHDKRVYKYVRKNYMYYDYCYDRGEFFNECHLK
ncbi:PREDICTED: putative xyloglucan endotransglucosylase/hydrolase protein 1 [Lupinus angustifolius]|uniref:putative xyloglucan endotransglucosylase/hydrolase protein 1 n=1 Tax=Lupinus angustifolius TaxID=3871 RepID=UPI00092F97BB|nr:PREDICTED: putative xyloglucan endotransglucosylase/hydrolase protein 1 [Lupinus angustifolius]